MFHTCSGGAQGSCDHPDHYAEGSQPAPKMARNGKGKSLRIDIHCHYLNLEVNAKAASLHPHEHEPAIIFANAMTKEVNLKQWKDRAGPLSDIDRRIKDMDRMGIDIQAVSGAPSQYYYWTEPGVGLEFARDINNRIAEIVAMHPDRFVGL